MKSYKRISAGVILGAILIGLAFYLLLSKRNIPEVVLINYTNVFGEEISAAAFSGEVNLFVKSDTDQNLVKELVVSLDGSILDQISGTGIYLIGVPKGAEANFIKESLKSDFVIFADPNFALEDLGLITRARGGYNYSPPNPSPQDEALPAPTCAVTKRVIMIDEFTVRIAGKKSHGESVNGVINSVMGELTVDSGLVTKYALNGDCSDSPNGCISSDGHGEFSLLRALNQAMTDAKIRNEKIVINLSMGPGEKTIDGWIAFQFQILHIMASHTWSKQGNVILNIAAGNDALNIKTAIDKLRKDFASVIDKNIIYYGTLQRVAKELTAYTNYDSSLMYAREPQVNLIGTSFTTPIGAGVTLMGWIKNPCADSGQVAKELKDLSCHGKGFEPCFIENPAKTIDSFFKTYTGPVILPAAPLKPVTTPPPVSPPAVETPTPTKPEPVIIPPVPESTPDVTPEVPHTLPQPQCAEQDWNQYYTNTEGYYVSRCLSGQYCGYQKCSNTYP